MAQLRTGFAPSAGARLGRGHNSPQLGDPSADAGQTLRPMADRVPSPAGRSAGGHCGTCFAMAAVKAGLCTEAAALETIRGWSRHVDPNEAFVVDARRRDFAPPGLWSDGGGFEPLYSTTIDAQGAGACTPDSQERIADAVDYILDHINDIRSNSDFIPGRFRWLPSPYPRNPRGLVAWTLGSNDKVLRVHCTASGGSCADPNVVGWTVPQFLEQYLDVYICSRTLDATTPRLACLLVHELMHAWGVGNEIGADRAEPNNWDCFGCGCSHDPKCSTRRRSCWVYLPGPLPQAAPCRSLSTRHHCGLASGHSFAPQRMFR